MSIDYQLLQQLCKIHAPSGNEIGMKDFLRTFVIQHQNSWKVKPEIIEGDFIQDCMILKFGKPTTAIFAHMDSIGFTVRYHNEVVKIGGPVTTNGIRLVGKDSQGDIQCTLKDDRGELSVKYNREIERGTELVFEPSWRENDEFIQCCYMDNRLGVWNALKVAETLENGVIVFSCWEEHGGGSVGYLAEYMYKNWGVRQALISDITWVTEGVPHGKGVAISIRDRGIPRRKFIDKIIELGKGSGIPFQLEVEGAGSSDGGYLQSSHLPFDWCFIGAPEDFVHSPDEKVHKADIDAMWKMYAFLMERL
jgi:putative aminopeptidase FrvX